MGQSQFRASRPYFRAHCPAKKAQKVGSGSNPFSGFACYLATSSATDNEIHVTADTAPHTSLTGSPNGSQNGANATPMTAFDRIDVVLAQAEEAGATRLGLGTLAEALKERAFGLLILALALPCCLPFVYLIPQIVALPMLVLTGQMASGRQVPWLPEALKKRDFDIASMRSVVARGKRWFGWAEHIARPRLLALSGPRATRLVGALLVIPSASILVPLPSTNTVPGIGVAIASIGLIERDGLMILLGLFIGLAWVAFLLISAPLLALWLVDFFA